MYDSEMRMIDNVLKLISGKWTSSILCNVYENGPVRFGELKRNIPGISQRVLTACLKDLEKEGLVERKEYESNPPKVEYRISAKGKDLEMIYRSLYKFGERHMGFKI